jgi:branched-subunit amino acid ABC-type transport system permease component
MENNLVTSMAICFIIAIIIGIIINLFFSWSMYKALKLVPEKNHIFPSWFVWLFIIPLVGFVFHWIMLPFGIPQAFEKTVTGNETAVRSAKQLFLLGLILVVLITMGFIPFLGFVPALAGVIIWIVYWVLVVKFREMYLDSKPQSNDSQTHIS